MPKFAKRAVRRGHPLRSIDATYAFSAEAQVFVPRIPLALGAGRRFGPNDRDLWFGTAGVYWQSRSERVHVTVKAQFGDSYVSGLATLAFRLAGSSSR
jgi:hypothetical protein